MPSGGFRYAFVEKPERVYRGFYGLTAQSKIRWSQARKGFRAVFPDCRTCW